MINFFGAPFTRGPRSRRAGLTKRNRPTEEQDGLIRVIGSYAGASERSSGCSRSRSGAPAGDRGQVLGLEERCRARRKEGSAPTPARPQRGRAGCSQNMKRGKHPTDGCAQILLVLIGLGEERGKEQVEGRGALHAAAVAVRNHFPIKILIVN